MASSYARQMLRDERAPRVKRINALAGEVHACIKANAYDAALVMQFVELDTWAFLARPGSMTVHGRTSFKWFIERYMRDAPGQGYSYAPSDVYAARCGLLHTFGSLADAHERDKSVVIWRFHLGRENTFVPGLHRMAYISVMRFITDACAAVSACVKELYQRPYPVTAFAHGRLVSEAMRSVICISLFQASQHASRMAS